MEKGLTSIVKYIQSELQQSEKGDKLYETLASKLVNDFGARLGILGARIWVIEGKNTILKSRVGGIKDIEPGLIIRTDYSVIQKTLEEGIVIADQESPGYDRTIEERIGSKNFISIKLADDRLLSVEVDEIENAEPALRIIKATLDATLKIHDLKDMNEFASLTQRSLLPKSHDQIFPEYYDVAWFAEPAKIVGGDLLMLKQLEQKNQGIAIAISDSKGKGISASTMALSIYTAITENLKYNPRATVLVSNVNEILKDCDITEQFASLFYCTLPKNGVFSYVNAGHPPAFLINRSGIKKLETGGTLLGAIKDAEYEPGGETLHVGETLVIYTDGLYEIENPKKEMLDIDGLEEIVKRCNKGSSQEIVNKIIRTTKGYMGQEEFPDDITLAVIRKIK